MGLSGFVTSAYLLIITTLLGLVSCENIPLPEYSSLKLDPPRQELVCTIHLKRFYTNFASKDLAENIIHSNINFYPAFTSWSSNDSRVIEFNNLTTSPCTVNVIVSLSKSERENSERFHSYLIRTEFMFRSLYYSSIYIIVQNHFPSVSTIPRICYQFPVQVYFHILHKTFENYNTSFPNAIFKRHFFDSFQKSFQLQRNLSIFSTNHIYALEDSINPRSFALYSAKVSKLPYPLCLQRNSVIQSSLFKDCDTAAYIIQHLQQKLNFTVSMVITGNDYKLMPELQSKEFLAAMLFGYINPNYDFGDEDDSKMIGNFKESLSTLELGMAYCSFKFKERFVSEFLLSPFQKLSWSLLALSTGAFVLLYKGTVSNNRAKKSVKVSERLFNYLKSKFENLLLHFQILIGQEFQHKSIILTISSVCGLVLTNLYTFGLTSEMVIPDKAQEYETVPKLIAAGYDTIYYIISIENNSLLASSLLAELNVIKTEAFCGQYRLPKAIKSRLKLVPVFYKHYARIVPKALMNRERKSASMFTIVESGRRCYLNTLKISTSNFPCYLVKRNLEIDVPVLTRTALAERQLLTLKLFRESGLILYWKKRSEITCELRLEKKVRKLETIYITSSNILALIKLVTFLLVLCSVALLAENFENCLRGSSNNCKKKILHCVKTLFAPKATVVVSLKSPLKGTTAEENF